jgi:hypothetical protein
MRTQSTRKMRVRNRITAYRKESAWLYAFRATNFAADAFANSRCHTLAPKILSYQCLTLLAFGGIDSVGRLIGRIRDSRLFLAD